MRGSDAKSGSLFSYVDLEKRVPAKHPLRVIKSIVDEVLLSLDADFAELYEGTGRQSIAPRAREEGPGRGSHRKMLPHCATRRHGPF